MTIRERLEQQEYMLLAPNAQKAAETKGRLYPAEENEVQFQGKGAAFPLTY